MGTQTAVAETWPAHTIVVVVPFAAGSAGDVIPRVVLEQVSQQIKVPIVIENRNGAGGTIGANKVAHSAADGYTMLATGALAAAHGIYAKAALFDDRGLCTGRTTWECSRSFS